MKSIDAEYYGYRDEDDGILEPLEQEHEKKGMQDSKTSVSSHLVFIRCVDIRMYTSFWSNNKNVCFYVCTTSWLCFLENLILYLAPYFLERLNSTRDPQFQNRQ